MLGQPERRTANPVGTGPFVFKEWVPNSHFTATANPHYWRPGLPYLDQITFKPILDEDARAEALKSGTIDMMITDTPQIITQFRGNKKYAYIDDSGHLGGRAGHELRAAQPGVGAVQQPDRPACRRHGHQPEPVRQGDRRERDPPVSNGLFSPGSPYYSKTSYPAYNPTEAKKLVKQVAASGGPSAVTFTLGIHQ